MEIGKKTIAAGIGLFFLGGLSVYLLMANSNPAPAASYNQTATYDQAVIPEPPAQTETTTASTDNETGLAETHAKPTEPAELTHDEFLAQAEARREQLLIDKAEADRLEKMRLIKERSVECKFWRQQQKNSSASSKIEEKITQYCTLQAISNDGEDHPDNNGNL